MSNQRSAKDKRNLLEHAEHITRESLRGLAEIAAEICGMPHAAISLFENDIQKLQATVGLPDSAVTASASLCRMTLEHRDLLEIPDTRLSGNPNHAHQILPQSFAVHYVGIPLRSEEENFTGILCIMDTQPGRLTPTQNRGLRLLANQVARQLGFLELLRRYRRIGDHYADIYAESPIAEILLDKDGFVINANLAAQLLFGISQLEMAGKKALEPLLSDESWSRLSALMSKLTSITPATGIELQTRYRDNATTSLLANMRTIPATDAAPEFVHLTLQNISHLKRIENDLVRERQFAEAANRAKSDFLAVMSHEIRTPLNGVMGMIGVLKDTPLNAEQRRYLDIIERSGNILMSVINNVLDFSKIQAEAMERSDTAFDLADAISEVTDIFSARAAEKNLTLLTAIDPRLPAEIVTDPTKFRQILLNLTGNAIKFTEKGSVAIRAELIHRAENSADIEVSVEDTGQGITKEKIQKLFIPFAQADHSIGRRFGGTGLGLAICKSLVEILGGDIRVESVPDSGTAFRFQIPVRYESSVTDNNYDLEQFTQKTALIVDNMPVNLEVLSAQLKALNIRVLETTSPETALQLAADEKIDFAFIDLNMPGMNGIELATLLRSIAPDTHLILLSSLAVAKNEVFDQTLTKPLSRRQLIQSLIRGMAEKETSTRIADNRRPLEGQHILIVEDEAISQTISKISVEKLGATCDIAENAAAAIELAKKRAYDLVLLDIHLPDQDGFILANELRALDPDVKLIAFTADITILSEEKLLQAGIMEKLSKPVTLSEFSQFIARINGS